MPLYRRPAEEQRRIRNAGGLCYRAVEERQGGLYCGDDFVCRPEDHWGGDKGTPIDRIGGRYNDPSSRLFRCHCGAWFIGHWSAKQCVVCRHQEKNAKFSAQRSEKRAEARAARPAIACEGCGKPVPAQRSTRKYCSDACRQRDFRQREA